MRVTLRIAMLLALCRLRPSRAHWWRASGGMTLIQVKRLRHAVSLLCPAQKQSDVAWHSAGKFKDPRAQPEAMRLQIPLSAQINFRRFAAQRCRLIRLAQIHRATGVASQLARKTAEQEFFSATLCRLTRLVQQNTPALVRNVIVDQLCDVEPPLLRGSTTVLLAMQHFLMLVTRH